MSSDAFSDDRVASMVRSLSHSLGGNPLEPAQSGRLAGDYDSRVRGVTQIAGPLWSSRIDRG